MKTHTLTLFVTAIAFLTSSCMKEDKAIVLPPPGDQQTMSASMGINYDDQVYVDLATGAKKTVPYRIYDLAFEASPNGFRVYLNTGKLMFVANTHSVDLVSADSTGKEWKTETEHLYDDSTAFGDWRNNNGQSLNEVYVIDRGRVEHFGAARWRKMQILSVNNNEYVIRFSMYDNSQLTDFTIPKNSLYSLMYFSFENGGHTVEVAPPQNQWHLVFTKYTYTYYSEPVNSPYRYYLVTGALLNKWAGNTNEIVQQDSTANYKLYNDVTAADLTGYQLTDLAGKIGFSWKEFDFNLGYIIYNDRFYLLRDSQGYVYKIRFYDFYDDQGNKGTAKFEYQRL